MNIHISGNLDGRTVVFVAGWPDTPEVFRDNLMMALAPRYRLVGLTLPGFDNNSPLFRRPHSNTGVVAPPVPPLGYSFDDLVDLFEIAVLAAMEHRPLERPMLIAHDWGCILAYEFLLTRPYFFSRVVMLDIGGPVSNTSLLTVGSCCKKDVLHYWLTMTWVLIYHVLIIAAYMVFPVFVGKRILRLLLRVAGRPQYRYPCTSAVKSDNNDGKEFVLVSSYVQEKKKSPPRWCRWKSLRFVDIVNAIIHFGQDTDNQDDVNTLDAAFHPSRFYYAKGSLVYTLPPHPNAIRVRYTCYNCHNNGVVRNENCTSNGNNKSKCCDWSNTLPAKMPSDNNNNNENNENNTVDVDPALGWIYLRYWMLRISRLLPASQRFLIPISVPVLFLYGAQKPVMLHTRQWEEYIALKGRGDGSEVVGIPGGHWFFAERSNRRQVAERVVEFLDKDPYESLVG